jgi:TRAP transporter TAXI family solute receptor
MRPVSRIGTAMLLALMLVAGCPTGSPPAAGKSTPRIIATGSQQGVYYQYGAGFVALSGSGIGPVQLTPTTGSVENLRLIGSGAATFAFTAADAAIDGYTGRPPFASPVPIRALARLYDDYIHLVVPADSPVRTVNDLRGRKVSIGPEGSGTALIAGRVLAAYRLDPRTAIAASALSLDDSVTALKQHRIDAFFWSGGLPTSGIVTLAKEMPIRLVGMADAAAALRERYGPAYLLGTVPRGTYPGLTAAVATVAVPNYLVTAASTSDELVRDTTEALFVDAPKISERVPAAGHLDRRTAIYTEPIPLHPGALAYYRQRQP